jgi:hypothetical protein
METIETFDEEENTCSSSEIFVPPCDYLEADPENSLNI